MATITNDRPMADDLNGTVREYAEASIKDVQDLAAEAWKAWSAATLPIQGRVDAREVLSASFDMAGSVLDAQRQLAQRLVGAAPAAR